MRSSEARRRPRQFKLMKTKKKSTKKKIPRKEMLKKINDFIMKLPLEYLDELLDRAQDRMDELNEK